MVNGILPDGWTMTTLGAISIAQSGVGFPKTLQGKKNGDYPLAKVSDITESVKTNNGVIASANNYLSTSEAKKLGAKIFPEGTTLFAKIGEAVGLNRRVLSAKPILADNNVMGLIPDKNLVAAKFLYYFMQTIDLYEYSQATTVPSVRKSDVEGISFPLAPLPDQERIVAKIEELFTQLEAGTAALERVQAGLKRYKASVLKAAVEGKLGIQNDEFRMQDDGQLPAGWKWVTWKEISPRVTVGYVGKMKDEYTENGIPFLRGQNVRENRFDPNGLLHVSPEFHKRIAKSTLNPGDIVVVRSGAVGVSCVIPETLPEANCSDLVIIKKPKAMIPEFGAYYLNSLAKSYVREKQVGVALTHFNTKSVADMPVPLPPLEEQRQIVAEVERRLSLAAEVESTLAASLSRAGRLRQAVLKSAFEGRLV